MQKLTRAAGSSARLGKGLLVGAALLATSLGACNRHQTETPITPPQAQVSIVPGGEATTVIARTGSESSGTEGSSTVIGAPPRGQAGTVIAH